MMAGLWMLIKLGFLKGMEGDNRFGFDPRASSSSPQTA